MRKLSHFIAKYGPEMGPKYYHVLQSQAAHAGVSARLRRKIEVLTGQSSRVDAAHKHRPSDILPLFPEPVAVGSPSVEEPVEPSRSA